MIKKKQLSNTLNSPEIYIRRLSQKHESPEEPKDNFFKFNIIQCKEDIERINSKNFQYQDSYSSSSSEEKNYSEDIIESESPSVRGYRSLTKKLAEEKDFNDFLEMQEKKFLSSFCHDSPLLKKNEGNVKNSEKTKYTEKLKNLKKSEKIKKIKNLKKKVKKLKKNELKKKKFSSSKVTTIGNKSKKADEGEVVYNENDEELGCNVQSSHRDHTNIRIREFLVSNTMKKLKSRFPFCSR